ncbi:homeobox protein cut-like isoform X2 [Dermatophagoides pteronyssinus]|uniref:homeobox protein cut-like isoform X2 n=1 Tax=Dermatophagoides pteronyssinus TaxID=6956 RepID=UPI003F668ED4
MILDSYNNNNHNNKNSTIKTKLLSTTTTTIDATTTVDSTNLRNHRLVKKDLKNLINTNKFQSLSSNIFNSKLITTNNKSIINEDDVDVDENMMDKTTTSSSSSSSATSSDGEEMVAGDNTVSNTLKNSPDSHDVQTPPTPQQQSQQQQQQKQTKPPIESGKMSSDHHQNNHHHHHKNDSNLADLIKRLKCQITQLQDLVTQKDKKIIDLNEKLDQQSDYDDIKRELSMVRNELSHFGPMVTLDPITSITTADDDDDDIDNNDNQNDIDDNDRPLSPTTIITTDSDIKNLNNSNNNHNQRNSHHQHHHHHNQHQTSPPTTTSSMFNPFNFPPLQSLGNVESFGSLLGEEIANSYAKVMAAAAIASSNSSSSNNNHHSNNNNNNKTNHSSSSHCSNHSNNNNNNNNNNGNNNNNPVDSPSQLLNGDIGSSGGGGNETLELDKSNVESASTTPTASAMICSMDGAEPLTHSPLGATTVTELGLIPNNYSHNIFYDKLQHQLRCNVEKYMNETLNTLQISRYVRELLSVHNIGQRLFAKYVLGLSQGTVSELLSKPKPWDKLTEKGRDSYRKMHAWSTDDRCINLLKMMVPRKEYGSYLGKDSNSYNKQDETSGAEERIAQILSEAQRSMKGVTPLNRQELLAQSFINGDSIAASMAATAKSMADLKDLKNTVNDTISDNGSDRDENKSETQSLCDRKSPSSLMNPTAMATISNFYKNINDPILNERSINNHTPVRHTPSKLIDNTEEASELIRLYQAMIGQQIEEGLRNPQNYDDIRNVIALHQELSRLNPFIVQQSNPEMIARLFSSGILNGANYLNGLPLALDPTLQSSGNQFSDNPIRKLSPIDSPQQQRESSAHQESPRIKIDNLLSQMKTDSASPSHNGNSSSTGHPCPLNSASTNAVFNNANDSPDDLAASPLQRIQSITNSLLSQSSLPSLPSQPPRPAKAVLPPITQQQFDQYNNLNTEDIVKRVKEQLSQYSISQRLFGESVLGLSQGSVSDLLARPKPWHMLTQKGREPFIRMKMFLEDDNAIHKLVASQYKIAPEKLMRTGNFVSGPGIPPTAIPGMNQTAVIAPPTPQLPDSPQSLPQLNVLPTSTVSTTKNSSNSIKGSNAPDFPIKYEQSLSPSSVDNSIRSNTSSPDLASSITTVPSPTPVTSSPSLSMRSRLSAAYNMSNNLLRPVMNQPPNNYMQPSVYELAALTSDLDTQNITTRIKETLMAHNIGQKIFGEVVLGLSQGSVSELLSKPKPWHMLSIKGREPFIRMQLWLNDTNNIDKLQTLKNERREANKRRRTHLDESLPNFKPFDNQLLNQFPNFGQLNSLSKNMMASPGATGTGFGLSPLTTGQPVVKKARILFTEEQKEALRVAFSMDPYPSSATAEFLAKELNLSIRTITNWFHNHRMRLKQINSSASSSNDQDSSNPATAAGYNIGRDNVLFDQNKFRQLLSHRLSDIKQRSNNLSNNSNHGNNVNDNSNQFGSSAIFPSSQNSPPSNHRMKYSPSMFQTQSIYSNNTNSCSSPGSSSSFHEEEDLGTLDLNKLDSTGRSSMHDDSDDGCRDTGDDDDNDDVPLAGNTDAISTANNQQQSKQRSTSKHHHRSGSSRRKPQNVMSSSSRRKAAQPQQWVAPVNPSTLIADDDYIDDEFVDDDDFTTGDKQLSSNNNNNNQDLNNGATYDNQDDDDGYMVDKPNDDQQIDDDDDDDEDLQKTDNEEYEDDEDDDSPSFKKHKSSHSSNQLSSQSSSTAISKSNIIQQECVQ